MNSTNLPNMLAWSLMHLLVQRKALLSEDGIVFYVWQATDDRLIVFFDPAMIALDKVNADFVHALSTRLHGRLIVKTNSRGLFLQVGLHVPLAPKRLEATPLDLSKQPTPWSMPVGDTMRGPLWVSLLEGDSFLIGGSRDGGKTGEIHAWIQALLHGNKTLVYAWDGKRGAEFGRYLGHPNFRLVTDAKVGLQELQALVAVREQMLLQSGYPNILMHNEAGNPFIMPIASFVDEAADLPDSVKEELMKMIRVNRFVGLHPIIATNQPTQAAMMAKTNLSTRIAFRVPQFNDSLTIIGYKGAESLPDVRGRGLIVWKGNIIEFQSFTVTYPMPTIETMQRLSGQVSASNEARALPVVDEVKPSAVSVQPVDEIAVMAEKIRKQWSPTMNQSDVSRLFGKENSGTSWHAKIKKVIDYLVSTTPPTTENVAENGNLEAVLA